MCIQFCVATKALTATRSRNVTQQRRAQLTYDTKAARERRDARCAPHHMQANKLEVYARRRIASCEAGLLFRRYNLLI